MYGLEDKYKDKMNFIYLDIDDQRNDNFKLALDFRYQPQLVLLAADGTILQQWVGFVGGEELESALLEALE